jgi:16S rRNA (cytosine967-C5)-methyltransferase
MGSLKKKTPRAICLEILNRIETSDRHPDRLLTDSFKRYRHLISLDRAFLTELTYGVLRWRGRLDWVIGQFSKVPVEKIEPEILNSLRLGLYQILFLSRTPSSAAVNESVELAKAFRGRGGAGFVNAILRSAIRGRESIPYPDPEKDPFLHLSVVHSHPLWLVRKWAEEMDLEETERICDFNNQMPVLTLRANTLKMIREDLIERLKGEGLRPSPTLFSDDGIMLEDSPPVSELPFLKEGYYMIQNEASQLVTSILDPKSGERILDACAAPGGKTTHMAQKMGNGGKIYAVDLTRRKLRQLEDLCGRLGVKSVRTVQGDASKPLPTFEGKEFDRILADVPCSGFGTLQRNPDLKWKKREEDIRRLSVLQFSILRNLAGYLKKGGILVYSTCTVFREENEEVVERFMGEYPEFRLDGMDEVLPAKWGPFAKDGYFKTFPPRDRMDGFFVARLIREMG